MSEVLAEILTPELRALLDAEQPRLRRCSYCGCDPQKPSWDDVAESFSRCNNCRVDAQLKGQWTGHGFGYLSALWKVSDRQDLTERLRWITVAQAVGWVEAPVLVDGEESR